MADLTRRSVLSAATAWLAAGSTAQANPPSARIVAYGDSLTQGIALYNKGVTDLAIHGAGILNGRHQELLGMVDQIRPGDRVIMSLGTNDAAAIMTGRVSLDQYKNLLRQRIQDIQAHGGSVTLLGVSAERDQPGLPHGWMQFLNGPMNNAIRDVATSMHLPFSQTGGRGLERGGDGLHYNVGGYRQLFENAMADTNKPPPAPGLRPQTPKP